MILISVLYQNVSNSRTKPVKFQKKFLISLKKNNCESRFHLHMYNYKETWPFILKAFEGVLLYTIQTQNAFDVLSPTPTRQTSIV